MKLQYLAVLSCTVACTSHDSIESSASAAKNGGIRGAIFTSLVDGSRVNANIYDAKEDVYLDGGPGPNAPSGAAALAAGDYYFQVTDPSGKVLLSSDDISCREFRVNADGVIEFSYSGAGGCQHATGTDSDYASLGAITVQLMPYADTPNPGGEYKVWVTPVERYELDAGRHGFVPRWSKTDNFKVRASDEEPPPPPPAPCCGDGHLDSGEQCDDGNTTSGDGCSATCTVEQAPPPPPPCCGDGQVGDGEQCDDGNTTSGDGCSATCTAEEPPPPPPAPCCGDGNVDAGEQCDDGNTANGDGCSSSCKLQGNQH